MRVSLLVAIGRNRVIGTETGLPWHLPADLKRFRKLTLGKPIILGRTTFEHIGRPLDGRRNIVLSRRPDFRSEGVEVASDWDQALVLTADVPEVAIIGGAEVYRAFLSRVDCIHLTIVDGVFTGNAYFPDDLAGNWQITHTESHPRDDRNPHDHRYLILERHPNGPLHTLQAVIATTFSET